jgi:glycosyltransferase involved in cell wall biosynthesis
LSALTQGISVVVPVNNGGERFVKCLNSIVQAIPSPQEIIVVVDGGEDNSWQEAQKLGVQVIREPVSGGPARARNRGAREATGDIILFLDADVTVPASLIGQVSEIFEREPKLAAVIGSYDDDPEAANFFSRYKNLLHHFTHQNASSRASTFWGACGAIRRHIFLAAGGFDESYRKPSIEDIELGYRLTETGHEIKLVKSLQVKHLKRWGFLSLLNSDFFCRALPWTQLILRDRRFIRDLNLQVSSRICVFASYGVLGALFGSVIWPWLLGVAVCLVLLLLSLNVRLIFFFYRKGGWWFAARAMAWHYLYFLYSGLAFAIETLKHLARRWKLASAGQG